MSLAATKHGASAAPDHLRPVEADAPMSLWLADLGVVPSPNAFAWLDADELDRAARFRQARDRSRYLAAHVSLRQVVDRCCGIAPDRQRYRRDASGKWRLANRSVWHFNLSYAGDAALIGIARGGAVGVDIEAERIVEDAAELADLHFDPEERVACAAAPDPDIAFLRGWTRKEACLKAVGAGLRLAPASIHTGLEGTTSAVVGGTMLDVGSFRTGGLIAAWARVR